MPRRRRFKPRKDCEAILGKLSSYSSLYHYVYNPPQTPPFEKEGLVVSLLAYLTCGENYPQCHIFVFARYLWHFIKKLRGARLVLYARRIVRIEFRGSFEGRCEFGTMRYFT
jgi:hypothetical protein